MPAIQEKQLGQSRPTDTSAASIYSPASNTTAVARTIYICNTTASSESYYIYVDDDSTTYDQSTAICYATPINAYTTVKLETFIAMNNPDGNLAIKSSTGSALTFTVFGIEITSN